MLTFHGVTMNKKQGTLSATEITTGEVLYTSYGTFTINTERSSLKSVSYKTVSVLVETDMTENHPIFALFLYLHLSPQTALPVRRIINRFMNLGEERPLLFLCRPGSARFLRQDRYSRPRLLRWGHTGSVLSHPLRGGSRTPRGGGFARAGCLGNALLW